MFNKVGRVSDRCHLSQVRSRSRDLERRWRDRLQAVRTCPVSPWKDDKLSPATLPSAGSSNGPARPVKFAAGSSPVETDGTRSSCWREVLYVLQCHCQQPENW